MSVTLHPNTSLDFSRPLTQSVIRSLNITNPNADPVSFKIKTTAPKLYCVRPNSGKVDPGQTVEVQVMLQAMKEEPPLNAKCEDKFLIQSMLIPPEETVIPLCDLWTIPEVEETGRIHSQKVKVNYLRPKDHPLNKEDAFLHWTRVTLEPSKSLGFNRPLTRDVQRSLYITNLNADPVAYRAETTAPELYRVWPNPGKVGPRGTVRIRVMLQAMKEEPPLNVECEDELLIQNMLIPLEKAAISLPDLWTSPGGEETGEIHSRTVKLHYLPPEGHPLDGGDEFPHWITLQPSKSLGFRHPLTQNVIRSLNITNPNADPVSFKIKTTAPKLYNVRPNSGKVDPGQTVEVQVMHIAMKDEPPLNAKCEDKFLIQSMLIPPEKAAIPLHDLWDTLEGKNVHSQRIEVDYLHPEGYPFDEEHTLIISVG